MASNENLLQSLFSQGSNSISSFGDAGKGALGQATDFFKSLLSNPLKAAAPAANAVRSEADAAKKEQATKGTARTGGTAADNQQIEDEVRKQIGTLIQNAQLNAGGSLATIGQNEASDMLQTLGITTGAVQQDVQSQREASAKLWSSLIGGAGSIVGAVIGKKP